MKKKKTTRKAYKADPYLANANPTAISPEFVPRPTPDDAAAFTNNSDAVFDLLPELKTEKFK